MAVIIEMVSDLVCPWCWLGLRRAQAAMDEIGDEIDVTLVFRPFQLDPNVPREGMAYKDYMTAKFGGVGESQKEESRDRFSQMRAALEEYGAAEDIPFNFSGITVRPNTIDAHRLVKWAQGQRKGATAKEALFHAYFTDHLDIGNHEVLADIGEKIGLDHALVADLLAGDADLEHTREEEASFRQMGITGVPTYIADRRLAVSGAHEVNKLVRFIRTAEKDNQADVVTSANI